MAELVIASPLASPGLLLQLELKSTLLHPHAAVTPRLKGERNVPFHYPNRIASHRDERVGELIRHAVADILARGEVRDEAFDRHPLTIPAVRMSPDLKLATILVMPLGGKGAGAAVEALDRHKKELRTLVARRGQSQVRSRSAFRPGHELR